MIATNGPSVSHVAPSHVEVEWGTRKAWVGGDGTSGQAGAAYFLFSRDVRWLPPDENDAVSEEERRTILDAVCRYFEERKTFYVVDPTDEQYRTM